MIHWFWVGHFDPQDPSEVSQRPLRPKISRPLDPAAVERCLTQFPPEIAQYIEYDPAGFVICHWSNAGRWRCDLIRHLAYQLADEEQAVVMTEMNQVKYPPAAAELQQAKRRSLENQRLQSIERFALAATIFATWARQREDSGAIAARNALRQITELYLAALDLPAPAPGAILLDDDDEFDHDEWKMIYANCARLPIDYYGEIFDPLPMPPGEPVVGSVSDDIADIYREVVAGLRHYRAGRIEYAVWQWTFTFQLHWGEHATGAIRALQAWLAANEGFTHAERAES